MYKLEVKLKQHTPLVHFQHDQEGVTLRASEVKPKLDKFILTQIGSIRAVYEKALKIIQQKKSDITKITNHEAGQICVQNSNWLKRDTASLDYKLKIESSSNFDKYLLAAYLPTNRRNTLAKENIKYISPCPCFGDENKFGIMEKGQICLTFLSFNNELLDQIKQNIISFFTYNNFGFRQSKGFGCFSVASINGEPVEISKTINILNKSNKYIYMKKTGNNLTSIFSIITEDYQLLKSGRNYNGYRKSKLFEYMKEEKNLRWEKRKIKMHLKENHSLIFNDLKYNPKNELNQIGGKEMDEDDTFVFARILLGLAEHIEFTTMENRGYKNNKIKIKISDPSKPEKEIERFQSPLTFKVYDNNIYIIAENINEKIYDKEFLFKLSYELNDQRQEENLFTLKTPTSTQFDLIEFLNDKLISIGWSNL